MTIISQFISELESEAVTTRNMISRIPADKLDWAPHAKSMKMRNLAVHIAELPGWIEMAFETDQLDFAANPYEPLTVENTDEVLAHFEECMGKAKAHLLEENAKKLGQRWVLRQGDMILWDADRWGVIRMAISQMIHHRAQLGVYLRLLDIPIPGSYGPSADEQNF